MSLWWLLLLWPVSGLFGWAWANYSAFMHDGPSNASDAWLMRKYLLISPLLGPFMAIVNFMVSISEKKFYLGLRFR